MNKEIIMHEGRRGYFVSKEDWELLVASKFAYLELYLHDYDGLTWMFFYIGQGDKRRVEEYTANGGQPLYNRQARVEVFSVPICPLLANEFAGSLRSSPKFGKTAYFDGISKAQTEIERIYEAFLCESFYKLCKDLTNSNPSFTTDFDLGSAVRYEKYIEDGEGPWQRRIRVKQVQPTAFLSCANKAYFTRIPTEANEYKKYFLDEFCKISDQIKNTLLRFFVDKRVKI